jgi:hypothetical protein
VTHNRSLKKLLPFERETSVHGDMFTDAELREVIDEIANALQPAVLLSTKLRRELGAGAGRLRDEETSFLRSAGLGCISAIRAAKMEIPVQVLLPGLSGSGTLTLLQQTCTSRRGELCGF